MGFFKKNNDEKQKKISSISGNYDGGYVNIIGKVKPISLDLYEDKLIFKQLWKTYHTLDLECIKDVQYKTEEEISKDVTLTRILAFGIFAWGMKKKKVTKDYYLIISTEEEGFTNDIVIEIEGGSLTQRIAQVFIKELRTQVNKKRTKLQENQ